jgi:hypothetical protein
MALRRESGVAVKMVSREEVEVPVSMTEVQQSMYTRAMEQQHAICKCIKDAELVCTHPWCYATRASVDERSELPERLLSAAEDQAISDSSKMVELFNILRGLLHAREKVLVFFCRTITSDLVAALIGREFGTRPGIVRGDTPSGERDRLIREFRQEPDTGAPSAQVLLLSVWVGAVGLNLPEARWVIHVERVWNPALERQATSRVHRITSRLPVKAYCLFTKATIEEHKRTVLMKKHKLSTHIIDALDGDVDEEGDDMQTTPAELQDLIEGLTKRKCASNNKEANMDDDLMNEASHEGEELGDESEGEEQASGSSKKRTRRDQGLLPLYEQLKPRMMKQPMRGKYGDPCDETQWDWYTKQGSRDIHSKAPMSSTAGLLQRTTAAKPSDSYHTVPQFASGPSRVHDPKGREDREVRLDLGGATCRLFIPSHQQKFFIEGDGGALHIAPFKEGMLPFPILMPSFSRSAMDAEVGMLDLTGTIVTASGTPMEFLQIVAVRPSEVEKYRASGPFFVVMELPREHLIEHPTYGSVTAEELGVGAARHWLMRLADALQMKFAFMMDDSVRAWRGVTLVDDPHSMFGLSPGKKAQFTNIPLGQVLEHFADNEFMAKELQQFSVLGFARFCPDLYRAKCAYRRGHVYSAFLLNVPKLLHDQCINFNENLFIWEDLEFNLRAHDVCKCFRFVMIKKPYHFGGCTRQIARTENPYVRAGNLSKLTPEQIASEALGSASSSSIVQERSIVVSKKSKRKGSLAIVEVAGADADAVDLLGRSVYDLENDPALQADGAVCDEKGYLLREYYKKFREAFKEKERSRIDLISSTVNRRPGMRDGEEWPSSMRVWDDSKSDRKRYVRDKNGKRVVSTSWGAGWIAEYPFAKKGTSATWYNVKAWGTWRLAFVLARLQYSVWVAKGLAEGLELPAGDTTRAKRPRLGKHKGLRLKAGLKRKAAEGTPRKPKKSRGEHGSGQKMLAICDTAKPCAQPTILKFFGSEAKKAEQAETSQKSTLHAFFKVAPMKLEAPTEGTSSSSSC